MPMLMPAPEGSIPVKPEEMPLGQAENLHMPFNIAYHDKDFKIYK